MAELPSDISPEERQELISEFVGKGKSYLGQFKGRLFALKTKTENGQKVSQGDLEELQQLIHMINRMASCGSLDYTVRLADICERLLQSSITGERPFAVDIISLLLEASETLALLIDGLKTKDQETVSIDNIFNKIQGFLDGPASSVEMGPGRTGAENKKPVKKIMKSYAAVDSRYFEVYIDDTEQNIEKFNEGLVHLERKPDDLENINNLFRLIHTIKGSSGMISIAEVQNVAHGMENIFSIVRERTVAFADMFSIMFKGIDTINTLVCSLKEKKCVTTDVDPLIAEFNQYLEHLPKGDLKKEAEDSGMTLSSQDLLESLRKSRQKQDVLVKARSVGNDLFKIVLSIDENIPMKSMKVLLVEERLKDDGVIILMVPDADSINDNLKGAVGVNLLFCSTQEEKDIRSAVFLDGVRVVSVEKIEPKDLDDLVRYAPLDNEDFSERAVSAVSGDGDADLDMEKSLTQATMIRIDTHKLDSLMNLSGELITIRSKFERLLNMFNNEALVQKDFMRSFEAVQLNYESLTKELQAMVSDKEKSGVAQRIIRILDQLSKDINLINQRMVKTDLWVQISSIEETTGVLGKIASDIQAGVMQARMVPIKGVFSRFRRIVRDISSDIGKDVQLVIEGEETELDKNLVDSLGDPLTHMVRNAIDHGIEDPETRKKLGKPVEGTIMLSAFHQRNNICIEVSDDGKGLNPDYIAQHAKEKKLITQQQADQLTDKEKLDLIFIPGFSTAKQVTDLSGRGVGMDVVRNMIKTLKGTIEIDSKVSEGTTFALKIPLTLAIIQALLVYVGEEIYAMPLDAVVEVIKITNEMVYYVDGNATIKLRGHALSLIKLEDIIHISGNNSVDIEKKNIVVITNGEEQVGVPVDQLAGESEIVIKSLPYHFSHVKGISGATILGDGQISLILDPKQVMTDAK
jgi:two-component system chemotaxis sensor kinase CheA